MLHFIALMFLLFLSSIFHDVADGCIWIKYIDQGTVPQAPFPHYPGGNRYPDWNYVCSVCKQRKRENPDAATVAFLFHLPDRGFTCDSTNYNIKPGSNQHATWFAIIPAERPAIALSKSEIKVGEVLTVYTEYLEYVHGNDKNEFYFLNENFTKSENVHLVNHKEQMEMLRSTISIITDPFTKRYNHIIDTQERIFLTYRRKRLQFMMMDANTASNESARYATVIHSNDKFLAIDIQKFIVFQQPTKNCRLEMYSSDVVNPISVLTTWITVKTSEGCNRDLNDVHMLLDMEEMLEIKTFTIDHEGNCIGKQPDETHLQKDKLHLKYNRFYMGTQFCSTIQLKVSNNFKKSFLSRYVYGFFVISYIGYDGNVAVNKVVRLPLKMFLPTNQYQKNFYIRNEETGYCIGSMGDKGYKLNNFCSLFREIPKTIVDFGGISLGHHSDYGDIEFNGDIIKIKNLNLYLLADNMHDLFNAALLFSSSSPLIRFKRFYTHHSALNINEKDIDDVTLLEVQEKITILYDSFFERLYICSSSDIEVCYVYDIGTRMMTDLTTSIHQLLFLNGTKIYGRSSHTNYEYDIVSGHEIAVSQNQVESIKNLDGILTAISFTMNVISPADDNVVITTNTTSYLITYFGLYNELLEKYDVVWPSQSICTTKVGSKDSLSLSSCKQIKEYCPSVKNGYYWIHGRNHENVKYKVYCEMEFDEGGWLQLLNHTSDGSATGSQINDLTTENINEFFLSNNQKYLKSPHGFQNLLDYMDYTQLRFYCYQDDPGRTIHIKTLETPKGHSVLNYMLKKIPHGVPFCRSYFRYYDDNSKLTEQCSDSFGTSNAWGTSVYLENEIYLAFLYKHGRYGWAIENDVGGIVLPLCDSANLHQHSYGIWKLYVR